MGPSRLNLQTNYTPLKKSLAKTQANVLPESFPESKHASSLMDPWLIYFFVCGGLKRFRAKTVVSPKWAGLLVICQNKFFSRRTTTSRLWILGAASKWYKRAIRPGIGALWWRAVRAWFSGNFSPLLSVKPEWPCRCRSQRDTRSLRIKIKRLIRADSFWPIPWGRRKLSVWLKAKSHETFQSMIV